MPTLLLELGTEELPADFVRDAIAQWQELIPKSLTTVAHLSYEEIKVYGTPRRLALIVQGLPSQQADRIEEIKGPSAQAAFNSGQPTQAAIGFVRKQGGKVEDLVIRETDKGAFVFLTKTTPGQSTSKVLTDLALSWVQQLQGKRFMRWADGDLRFPRPIRTLVALLDQEILPLALVNGSDSIPSGRVTRGHRILHPEPVTLVSADSYPTALESAYVQVDQIKREEMIREQIEAIARELAAQAEIPPSLLQEVSNLVEWPTAIVGKFDATFLNLPQEVITTVMVAHQRYFPLRDSSGDLLPNFITISNGNPQKSLLITQGNERVIRARLADAEFFYQADCDEHLETYLPQLETVTFQEELGSMRDKVDRIMELSQQIADQLQLSEAQKQEIESTALLCKADLVTQMVYEFPELQGVMGQKYALVSGESPLVAQGIFEHYLPRGAEDKMPQSLPGQVVGISDRLDTLINIFGLGMLPTGSSDPFALRRAANALILIQWHAQLPLNLRSLIESAVEDFIHSNPSQDSPLAAVEDFMIARCRALLQDELKLDYDLANAVLPEYDPDYRERALDNLLDLRERALFLQNIRNNGFLEQIYSTVNRATRLASQGSLPTSQLLPEAVIDPSLLVKSSEAQLYQALIELAPKTLKAQSDRNYQLLVEALGEITPILSSFFDGPESVLVMDEDPLIRQNRLNLLALLRNQARVLADFGAIVKS